MTDMLDFCDQADVDQLSLRPVTVVADAENKKVASWARKNQVPSSRLDEIKSFIAGNGTRLLRLPHGAEIYDVFGQNVCLTDCLTTDEAPDQLRQIILMPNGRLTYSWQYDGAILLR